ATRRGRSARSRAAFAGTHPGAHQALQAHTGFRRVDRLTLHAERHEPSSCRRLRPAKYFARTFITSTNAIKTSAAAHASACSPGSGDSESLRIVTGSVGSAWWMLKEMAFAAIDVVKSSGAVSPAIRATEMTTPVRIPPIAAGRMMFHVVRHLVTPSARLAWRKLWGTT